VDDVVRFGTVIVVISVAGLLAVASTRLSERVRPGRHRDQNLLSGRRLTANILRSLAEARE
jgi:hypothetical protein